MAVGIPPGGVATGDENLRPSGKGCQWLLGRICGNAWDDEIAADFRGQSPIKKISRESSAANPGERRESQLDSSSFAQIRG
jgi:hypothetical protein